MKRSEGANSTLVRDIVEVIALTILIFLAVHFTIQNYQISGPSMQNTLHDGQFVLVNKLNYLFHQPERGDVIVFHEPNQPGRDLIKRVIGLPGDKIVLSDNNVSVNGVVINEPYITLKYNYGSQTEVVPPNQYFVMGDNRPVSEDSRYFGFVPQDYIVGKAILVYWPISRWQILNTYSSVYSQIK